VAAWFGGGFAAMVVRGYRISFSNKELAEFEFKKAVKLEVEGKTEEAADLYQKIFNDYGETDIAEDAKSAFIVLQKKLKKEDI
jgi:hypothetical protein